MIRPYDPDYCQVADNGKHDWRAPGRWTYFWYWVLRATSKPLSRCFECGRYRRQEEKQ